jgi:hypothetical protein
MPVSLAWWSIVNDWQHNVGYRPNKRRPGLRNWLSNDGQMKANIILLYPSSRNTSGDWSVTHGLPLGAAMINQSSWIEADPSARPYGAVQWVPTGHFSRTGQQKYYQNLPDGATLGGRRALIGSSTSQSIGMWSWYITVQCDRPVYPTDTEARRGAWVLQGAVHIYIGMRSDHLSIQQSDCLWKCCTDPITFLELTNTKNT